MGTTNDNQDITSEAPKLLLCSSIASASDPGSNAVTKPQAGKNTLNSRGTICIFPIRN